MTQRNWAGNVVFEAGRLHRPTSVEQLQDLVAAATRIKALGSGHSFNRIADTTGDQIRTDALPREVAFGADTVTLPGGAHFSHVVGDVDGHGRALLNLGSLPHISVAGAAATGTHGSGRRNQCLAATVRAVELVRADGELVTVEAGDPRFGGCVLSVGALGIVTRLALATQPAFDMAQEVWRDAPLGTVLAGLDDVMGGGYSVSMFSTATRPEIIDQIWVKRRADAPAFDGRAWGAHPADGPMHPIAGEDPRGATDQSGLPRRWHEILPHFRAEFRPSSGDEQQSEYFVAWEHAADAVAAVHGLGLGDVMQVMEIRAVAADDLWLSPSRDRDNVGLHFTWRNDDAAVRRACRRVEDALTGVDARPHWGKVFTYGRDELATAYPGLGRFRSLVDEFDPSRKFANAFLDRFVEEGVGSDR